MRSRHNTIRAVAIGLGLTLLVVTGTAAMMAAFSSPPPATDIYRRIATAPATEPASVVATGQDSVLYERVTLADGRTQWVLVEQPGTTLSLAKSLAAAAALANNTTSSGQAGTSKPVNYALVVKPSGLSKAVTACIRSTHGTYDIACNTMI